MYSMLFIGLKEATPIFVSGQEGVKEKRKQVFLQDQQWDGSILIVDNTRRRLHAEKLNE